MLGRRKKFRVKGSERLQSAFTRGGVARVPYLTAGYPTLEGAHAVGEAYVEAGADAVFPEALESADELAAFAALFAALAALAVA